MSVSLGRRKLCQTFEAEEKLVCSKYHFLHAGSIHSCQTHSQTKVAGVSVDQCYCYLKESEFTLQASAQRLLNLE